MKSHCAITACGRTLLLSTTLWLAACAGFSDRSLGHSDAKPAFRDAAMSMKQALDTVVPGVSTKASVAAWLGPATVIRFDSAFEVWVYRGRSAGPAQQGGPGAELVILFSPAGIATKARLRPPDGVETGGVPG